MDQKCMTTDYSPILVFSEVQRRWGKWHYNSINSTDGLLTYLYVSLQRRGIYKLRGAATETTVNHTRIRRQTLFLPRSFTHNADAAAALAVIVARPSDTLQMLIAPSCPWLPWRR